VRVRLPVALDEASEPDPDLSVVAGTLDEPAHPDQPVTKVK
jgi:hypothetical protein